jgi:thymidylate synthase
MADYPDELEYRAVHKPNSMIKGAGRVCVVTGWLSKELVASRANNSEYAAIGNLYSSSRGISFLVRNLLLNPHVCFIVIIESTKQDITSGSSRCLFDFFLNGVAEFSDRNGRNVWKINSDIDGFIDIEIEIESLEYIRKSITPILVKNIDDAVNAIHEFYLQSNSNKSSKQGYNTNPFSLDIKREFTLHSAKSIVKPNQLCGHLISANNIADAWVKVLHRIRTSGVIRGHGHDGEWQELIDVMTVVRNEPPDFYFPSPNYLPVDRKFISDYIPSVLYDSPYTEGVKYTYGQRMRSWFNRDQVEDVIQKITTDIDTASAVISLWDTSDHDRGGSPCLNHIWFRVNKINDTYRLSLTATFRSNDMFGAWVSNAMALRALQCHVGEKVSERIGVDIICAELITVSQSAHIYDDSWENVDLIMSNHRSHSLSRIDYYDPVGNFVIDVEHGEIIITHTHPDDGCDIGAYSGKNPLKLLREICADMPSISPSHSGYLGVEIHRAYTCLKNNAPYIQDC